MKEEEDEHTHQKENEPKWCPSVWTEARQLLARLSLVTAQPCIPLKPWMRPTTDTAHTRLFLWYLQLGQSCLESSYESIRPDMHAKGVGQVQLQTRTPNHTTPERSRTCSAISTPGLQAQLTSSWHQEKQRGTQWPTLRAC